MSLPTTKWTVLARLSQPGQAQSALDELCAGYWRPIFAFLREAGLKHEEAEDLTQGFFELVVRERLFSQVDRKIGRLRSFLLDALEKFRAKAARRPISSTSVETSESISLEELPLESNSVELVSTRATPEQAFDRAWLEMILLRVVEDLRSQYAASRKEQLFSALLPWLLDKGTNSQAAAAVAAGTSMVNFRVQLHRLRMRYRDELQRQIEATLGEGDDFQEELEYLFQIARRLA